MNLYNLLTNAQDEITKQAISWDSQKHLKFDMPFMDMKPTIYLGEYPASMHKRKRYNPGDGLFSYFILCIGQQVIVKTTT
jgi:hypothetical protein